MTVDRSVKRRKLSHSSQDGPSSQVRQAVASAVSRDVDSDRKQSPMPQDPIDTSAAKSKTANGDAKSRSRITTSASMADAALAGGSYKSNFFKLQVDELLAEIRPQPKAREKAAEEMLHKLKSEIESLPARPPAPILDAERQLITRSKIAVPFPNPRPTGDALYKLQYAPPTSINVIGSYALKTANRIVPVLSIDMLVTMPRDIFDDKDYLNHRYFYKRAYYLACIASGLQKRLGDDMSIRFESLHDNPLKPIIVVAPKCTAAEAKHARSWRINIVVGLSNNSFSPEKLLPHKNAVRDDRDARGEPRPTPFYNSSIQADILYTTFLKELHASSIACTSFKDACLLASVWLNQRGHSSSQAAGGFGNFEFAAIMSSLLRTGGVNGKAVLSAGYTSYQLFKATLQYLANRDLIKQPVLLDASKSILQAQTDGPIFFDGLRMHNILYKMSAWSYRLLRADVRATMATLASNNVDTFGATFISKADRPHLRYDNLITIPVAALASETTDDHQATAAEGSKLFSILRRGLGDRASFVGLRFSPMPSWELGSSRPSRSRSTVCTIALTLDPSNASRLVEHGPSAENQAEAADFRKFWGDKAELRRFQDGSILESLVWSRRQDPAPVVEQIIRHLLAHHFSQSASDQARFSNHGFACGPKSDSNARYQSAIDAYKRLETDIRSLEGLPLSIRQISASDPQLRSTSTESESLLRTPANVIVQFESSPRWPDDLIAIQRVKVAFLIKLGELLETLNAGTTTRIGTENHAVEIVNQVFLDVHYSDNSSFRIRINADKEQGLIEKMLRDKSAAPQTRGDAALALAEYKRQFVSQPAHTTVIQKLCTTYPTLSPAIVLTKKWFAAHLLSSDFSEELIELLVLRCFVIPFPFPVPSSAKTAFLRTLDFLATWDWRSEPLILPSLGSTSLLTQPETAAIRTRFEAWRTVDPAMARVALYVSSPLEHDGAVWTSSGQQAARPSKLLAGRMSALARAAIEVVGSQGPEADFEGLFVSSLKDYDFVIHLKAEFGTDKERKRKYKNLDVAARIDLSGAEAAALFVDELRAIYGTTIVFLYGGGRVVGGLWNPFVQRRPWKVNLGYGTRPIRGQVDGEETVLAEVNREGMLGEIARLGGDMIEKMAVNKT